MKSPANQQLDLNLRPPRDAGATLERLASLEELAALRTLLPATVQFGTAGWLYPEWRDLVWSGERSLADLELHGLSAYAQHPLLSAIYLPAAAGEPATESLLRRYAEQLPGHIHCLIETHRSVTSPRHWHHDTSHAGGAPGTVNLHFLDAKHFKTEILAPCEAAFGDRLGPFILAFPPTLARSGVRPEAFVERLHRFIQALPEQMAYAVLLNEAQYLTRGYAKLLAAYNLSHVFTTAAGMPPLLEQARLVPPSPELVVQVADPTGDFVARRQALQPFSKISDRRENMRREIIELLQTTQGVPAYVLVHNEAEGAAPLTVLALARMLAALPPRTEVASP